MKTLNEIYDNYQFPDGHGDKGTAHTYINEYSKLLEDYRGGSSVLEIGVHTGLSLKMWSEYFTDSQIYGIDISDRNFMKGLKEDGGFTIFIGDATQPNILDCFPTNLKFDVIIDDGSHKLKHQVNSFNIFKKRMNSNGLYIIEDIESIDTSIDTFNSMHSNCEIIDNRKIKNRSDDVLVIYRF